MKQTFYSIYSWLIGLPIAVVCTFLASLLTIIISPIFPNTKLAFYPTRWWAHAVCFLLFIRVKVNGLENIDVNQSYIFALNHQSLSDIFIVNGWLPNTFKWIMKKEVRKIPFIGMACQASGYIFLDRSTARKAKESMDKAKEQLKNGVSVVIFPEGTRTSTGEMGPFKRGGFRIASDLMLPIVPVTLNGCFKRLKRDTANFTPGKVEMTIHPPIDVTEYLPDHMTELMDKTWDTIHSSLDINFK